jgi:hypothetical protein
LRRALFQIGWHLHRLAYRLLGRRAAGADTLELRTVGRRSGQARMTIVVDGVAHRVRARETAGPERERQWNAFVAGHPGYAEYEPLAGKRTVPVVALEPAGGAAA